MRDLLCDKKVPPKGNYRKLPEKPESAKKNLEFQRFLRKPCIGRESIGRVRRRKLNQAEVLKIPAMTKRLFSVHARSFCDRKDGTAPHLKDLPQDK